MLSSLIKQLELLRSNYDSGMYLDIKNFLMDNDNIETYDISVNEENVYIIQIILAPFSRVSVKEMFSQFISFIGYSYINIFVCESANEGLLYKYYTSTKEGYGVKMDITIR